jgi:hypothetical protein
LYSSVLFSWTSVKLAVVFHWSVSFMLLVWARVLNIWCPSQFHSVIFLELWNRMLSCMYEFTHLFFIILVQCERMLLEGFNIMFTDIRFEVITAVNIKVWSFEQSHHVMW